MAQLEDFVERVRVELVRLAPARSSVPHIFGMKRTKEHAERTRINWVRSSMKVTAPPVAGSVRVSEARSAKPLHTVQETVDVYLFAPTDDEAEELFVDFVLAIGNVLSTPVGTRVFEAEGEWFIEESGHGDLCTRSACIRIPLTYPWRLNQTPQQVMQPTFRAGGITLNGEPNG